MNTHKARRVRRNVKAGRFRLRKAVWLREIEKFQGLKYVVDEHDKHIVGIQYARDAMRLDDLSKQKWPHEDQPTTVITKDEPRKWYYLWLK